MQSLSEEKLLGWCQAVLDNRSFWQKIQHQTNGFVCGRYSGLRKLAAVAVENAENVATVFRNLFSNFLKEVL
jgi:hypothetical protein